MVPSPEMRLSDRLLRAISPAPPFATAVVASGAVLQIRGTAVVGTLFDGANAPAANNDTMFNVASVSKALTAARVVSLAYAKVIDLDDPVAKHLPGVKLLEPAAAAGGAAGAAGSKIDRASVITIRHLLQHRGGLPHQPRDLMQKVNDSAKTGSGWSSPELLRVMTDSWEINLEGPPGQFRYSNTGYALLAAIVERVQKCSFADCMATYLKNELGMTHATFWPGSLNDKDRANAAHGRVIEGASETSTGTVKFNTPDWYGSRYAIPFTGLWTSMPDLAHFGTLILAASKDPTSPLHAMTVANANEVPLGLFRNKRLDEPSLEHDGSGPGFYAALIIVPAKNAVVALATNGGNESKKEGAVFAELMKSTVNALLE